MRILSSRAPFLTSTSSKTPRDPHYPRSKLPPCLVMEYGVEFLNLFHFDLSHLLPLSSFARLLSTAPERGARRWGSFLSHSGEGERGLFFSPPRLAVKLPRSCRGGAPCIVGICSLVFAVGFNFAQYVCLHMIIIC